MESAGKVVQFNLDELAKFNEQLLDYEECSLINEVIMEGHVEKLENRLKALGGK